MEISGCTGVWGIGNPIHWYFLDPAKNPVDGALPLHLAFTLSCASRALSGGLLPRQQVQLMIIMLSGVRVVWQRVDNLAVPA